MVSTAKRLTPAAAYVRMSSGKQERSPAQQKAEIRKLAEQQGCRIVAWFIDEGISGDSGPEKRPGFQSLLAAAERGEFKVLLLWDGDRLGRFDSLDGAEYLNRLRRSGVAIITCTDGKIDLDSFEGRVIHTVRQEGRHAYLLDLAKKVVRGKIDNAKRGGWNGGAPDYGLDRALVDPSGKIIRRLKPGETVRMAGHHTILVPCEDETKLAAVRFGFNRFATVDVSLRQLARELEGKGYPSPRGKGWTHQSVRRMLTNSQYVGTSRWGEATVASYYYASGDDIRKRENGDKGRWYRKPDEDAICVEGVCEGIIDVKLFDKVQRKLTRGERRRTGRRRKYPLSGLMFCEHCGKPMRGETSRGRDRKGKLAYTYVRYTCGTYAMFGPPDGLQNKTCGRHTIPADSVLAWLVGKLQEVLLGPGREELVRETKQRLKAKRQNSTADTHRLEKRLAELDREVDNLVKAVKTAPDVSELVSEFRAVRSERKAVRGELERLGQLSDGADLDAAAERIADETWQLGQAFEDADPATLRELLRLAVFKIVCRWEHVQQKGRLRCELVGGTVFLRECGLFDVCGFVGCTTGRTKSMTPQTVNQCEVKRGVRLVFP